MIAVQNATVELPPAEKMLIRFIAEEFRKWEAEQEEKEKECATSS